MTRCAALLLALTSGCEAPLDLGVNLPCGPGETRCLVDGGAVCAALDRDPSHCGACGAACPSAPNASPGCAAGRCTLRCDAGRGDCNGRPLDGCEADLRVSLAHCGACGARCAPGSGCGGGSCALRNLAAARPARQSSTYTAGGCDRGARLAVDGRLCAIPAEFGGDACADLGCALAQVTLTEDAPWWEVDLGAVAAIARVDVWNVEPARGLVVRLSEDGSRWRDFPLDADVFSPPAMRAVDARGRWVRLERRDRGSLHTSEVMVWAPAP